MILIITIDWDNLTFHICEWLNYYRIEFRIVSSTDEVRVEEISRTSTVLYNVTRNYRFNIEALDGVLYRQGEMVLYDENVSDINQHLTSLKAREKSAIKEYLGYRLNILPHVGQHDRPDLNKLVVLNEAGNAGLLVPDFVYTGNKTEVEKFKEKCPELITKIILPGFKYFVGRDYYLSYTEVFNGADFDKLPSHFHPTFFQQLVHKKFDIRVFYFNDELYTVATLSQKNKKTKIDLRKYDKGLPNRVLPFKLPQSIEKQLKDLVNNLSLSYCSIDMIYGLDKKFHFLEINPIGQFGVVSSRGNYQLEKKMAQWFKEKIEQGLNSTKNN